MAETDKNDRPIVGIGRGIRHQEQHYPPFEKPNDQKITPSSRIDGLASTIAPHDSLSTS